MLFADVGDAVQRGFDVFAEWVPLLVGALVILLLGYILAKLLGGLVSRLLGRAGLDRAAMQGQRGRWVGKITSSPSGLLGTVVFWVVLFGAVSLAATVLGIDALESLVASVYAYLPNVLAALLIFFVAAALAAGVAGLVARTMGDTTTGKVVATVAPVLIMAIAGFMILDQLEIAPQIVTITYAALMGAIALGMALAFGLGGRDVAARMLENAYEAGQRNREQVKQDIQQGRDRAREEAERTKGALEESAEGDAVSAPGRGETTPAEEPVAFEPADELTREVGGPGRGR